MTAPDCTPVSWLRLERYALGELAAREHADITAHLATCARCRACADRIAADAQRELPPLEPSAARAVGASRPDGWRWRWRWPWHNKGRRQAFALAAAMAALAAIFVLRPDRRPEVRGPRVVAVKGGDVTVELVRERDGSIAWEPASFTAADRFKLLVTCVPPLEVHADLVVVQDDGPVFPGQPALVRCGNRVPVPPAFRITGPGAATVCVLIDPTGPPSRSLPPGSDAPASTARACVRLSRAD